MFSQSLEWSQFIEFSIVIFICKNIIKFKNKYANFKLNFRLLNCKILNYKFNFRLILKAFKYIMSNLDRYKKVFIESFEIGEEVLNNLKYQDIEQWDSLGHMSMIASLEEEFDIMFEMDDIIDFSSFTKGIETLAKYGIKIN